MRDAELGPTEISGGCQGIEDVSRVFGPKRLEVGRQADLPSSVHFGRFALQFRELYLGGDHRVGSRNVELEVELELDQLVDVP